MQWSHAQDPERLARVEILDPAGKLAVHWEAETGRKRKKTLNKLKSAFPLPNAWSAALKLLFAEGFLLRGPQEGPLQWMTVTREPYPQGHPFAVDPSGDSVWVADTGFLRRVARGSAEVQDFALGAGATPRLLAFDTGGAAHALVDLDGASQPQGTPPWRAPSQGGSQVSVVRVEPSGELQSLLTLPWSSSVGRALGFASDGRMLAPHAEGLALHDPSGAVLDILPAQRCAHYPARGAVSESGDAVVFLGEEGRLELRQGGRSTRSPFTVSQLFELQLLGEDTVLLRGLCEHWGLFRWRPGAPLERLSAQIHGMLAGDRVHALDRGNLLSHPIGQPHELESRPMHTLGMVRRGRLRRATDGAWLFRTDTHTLGELDPKQL